VEFRLACSFTIVFVTPAAIVTAYEATLSQHARITTKEYVNRRDAVMSVLGGLKRRNQP